MLVSFAPQILTLFSQDAETISVGIYVIRMLSIGYLAYALNLVFDIAQAGAGDTLSPMIINLISLWLVQVPLAYILSQIVDLGANGIWLALVLGWIVQTVLMEVRFRQGRWKLKRI